ncbi:InlB B-repeat-containing protein [Adhaeribacter pallidiroseus]|uniref:Unsaturated chondroitin disaccharide hydrolase n=1 Tax=Adhaeribacter pallidiroseus TaxID=2072847 RepID=A0A369QQ05_9BACT|nr:putative Ig domain-containing protein [Adhaeribacter pallidiroseus]RDC65366.1 Unsaturated chondroitin disaccharide hydrolase [Adhaeribacter pallidiroseus]
MKAKFILFLASSLSWATSWAQVEVDHAFSHAQTQTARLLQEIDAAKTTDRPDLLLPHSLTPTGLVKLISSKEWTSGFFPGTLWFLYEHTKDTYWLTQAQAYTAKLNTEQFDTSTHDVGFKIYGSFGTGYRLAPTAAYRQAIIQAAQSLVTRFNAKTGCIRSWDHSTNLYSYPVIIDNMMNLELLFAATRLTGDFSYYNIAVSHANTTLKNHFRTDYSSWHVVDYDATTGAVIKKVTAQGYSNASAWARGQAWGLYGYTMCYRETKNPVYLQHAENIASFLFNHPNLPADGVPYWDYNAPLIPNEPRDASAAAIMASALYELSTYSTQASNYRTMADKIMTSLATQYISPVGENRGFILLHSTGNKPRNAEVDVPLNYADYYYLEALIRRKQTNLAPVLNTIENKTLTLGQTLNFTASATDVNANQTKTYSLVKAPAGASIHNTTGTFSWKPTQAGTFTFSVQVTDNGSPVLTGQKPVTVTVNPTPTYTLQVAITGSGSVTKNPNQTNYTDGTTVKLTATPAAGYRFSSWSGAATGTTNPLSVSMTANKSITANFTPAGPQVVSFTLINASTDQPIRNLVPNDVINLATVKNLNIRANTNPATTGRVVFNLSGTQTRNITESTAPYALFGDTNSNYTGWTPATGSYSLKATAYSSASGGTAGPPLTLNFRVENRATTAPVSLVVYPTPTFSGYIQVKSEIAWHGKITYKLLSEMGTTIATGELRIAEPTSLLEFNFAPQMLTGGIYYLHLNTKEQQEVLKLLRQ